MRTPSRARLGNCFNGRTIKTDRRIGSGYDEKANVKFESGKRQDGGAAMNTRNFFEQREGSAETALYFNGT